MNGYELPLILTALLQADLINVVYLTTCICIRSTWRCIFWMTSMTLNLREYQYLRHKRHFEE